MPKYIIKLAKQFLLLLLFALPFIAKAQKILVCDAVSRFPVRDVEVRVDGKLIGKTIYLT